jgi:hypothetical protein
MEHPPPADYGRGKAVADGNPPHHFWFRGECRGHRLALGHLAGPQGATPLGPVARPEWSNGGKKGKEQEAGTKVHGE